MKRAGAGTETQEAGIEKGTGNFTDCVFYFDVDKKLQYNKIDYYLRALGAKRTLFFSGTVTHIVTDKERTEIATYKTVPENKLEVIDLSDFSRRIKEERKRLDLGRERRPLEEGPATRRDLGETRSLAVEKTHHFLHPYLIIEDITEKCAPLVKEYVPDDKKTCPQLWLEKADGLCPFVKPPANYNEKLKEKQEKIKEERAKREMINLKLSQKTYGVSLEQQKTTQNVSLDASFTQYANNAQLKKTSADKPRRESIRIQSLMAAMPPAVEAPAAKKIAKKEKPGYCEYCYEKYLSLEAHIRLPKHRKYATDNTNYTGLDSFLDTISRKRKTIDGSVFEDENMPRLKKTTTTNKSRVASGNKKIYIPENSVSGEEISSPLLKKNKSVFR
ncbi:MAG: uncharacterized protein A8A55_0233 [Amphiamblys sp. WSBS2006]|nr:MAG: uncharacterized protein A8A55_0233 [Amphiamblys sp. WSBS2006]